MEKPILVIIAGGANKSFAPLVTNKTLFPFCDKPLIQYTFEMAKRVGFTEIIVATSTENDDWVRSFKLDGISIKTKLQPQATGMADALLAVEDLIGSKPIIVKSAADLVDDSLLQTVIEKSVSSYAVVPGIEMKENFPGGYIETVGERAVGIIEKPKLGEEPSNLVILTAHYFSKPSDFFTILKETHSDQDDIYEKALTQLMQLQEVSYITYKGNWRKLKYSYHVLDVMDLILKSQINAHISPSAKVSPKAVINGEVYIEDDAIIMDYAVIIGPAYIGPHVKVGQHTLVRDSMIEHDSTVGFASEVSRSYVGAGCKLHHNYLNDSVLEADVNPSYGTATANLRIDGQPIFLKLTDKKIPTFRRKMGAVLAKGVFCGINTSFMPGVTVGEDTQIYPGSVVFEALPPKSILKTRQQQEVTEVT